MRQIKEFIMNLIFSSYISKNFTHNCHRVIAAGGSQAELLDMGVGLQSLCKFFQGWDWNVLRWGRYRELINQGSIALSTLYI